MRCSIDCTNEAIGTSLAAVLIPDSRDPSRLVEHRIPIGFCADHCELLRIDVDALDEVLT